MKVFFTVKCLFPNSSKNFGLNILKFSLREVLIVGKDVHLRDCTFEITGHSHLGKPKATNVFPILAKRREE